MSNCSFCGNRPGLKCTRSPDLPTNNFEPDVLLRGQVFGLPPPSKYPPFVKKKLNDREMRDGIERHELWLYVPSTQVPRVGAKPCRTGCYSFSYSNMPMKKILCMAKRNKTLDGCLGKLKIVFPHFGKPKPKRPSDETGIRSEYSEINKSRGKIVRRNVRTGLNGKESK